VDANTDWTIGCLRAPRPAELVLGGLTTGHSGHLSDESVESSEAKIMVLIGDSPNPHERLGAAHQSESGSVRSCVPWMDPVHWRF
jgi:hypothetical protein